MKILITGASGQLGNELSKIIKDGKAEIGGISENIKNAEVVALDVEDLDITNFKQVKEIILREEPDVIINCAAITDVDECEIERDFAFKVNALGPKNLALISEQIEAKLVQVSTSYIFGGITQENPFAEFDLTSPYNVYGKTKLSGENFVRALSSRYFIVRTSWLYGSMGNNFVYKIRDLGKARDKLNIVNDQKGNPTNVNDLAYHILKIIETEEYGIYHCTGEGECTWYDFARRIIELSDINCEVVPCTSEEFKMVAKRPKYSSLDNMMLRCTVGNEMRNWEEALETFINSL